MKTHQNQKIKKIKKKKKKKKTAHTPLYSTKVELSVFGF